MGEQDDIPLDAQAEARLRRFSRVRRISFHAFWISLVLIFLGGGLAMASIEWAIWAYEVGFLIVAALLLQSYLVYPFLRCPRCGGRFFLPNEWLAFIANVNLLRKECVHCGLSLDIR